MMIILDPHLSRASLNPHLLLTCTASFPMASVKCLKALLIHDKEGLLEGGTRQRMQRKKNHLQVYANWVKCKQYAPAMKVVHRLLPVHVAYARM